MSTDDCPGRESLRRLVELRGDRELFLDEKSFVEIRADILRELVTLPRISLTMKFALIGSLAASIAATAYGVAMLEQLPLNFGLIGILVFVLGYSGRLIEIAACRKFSRKQRLAVIDELEAAGCVSASEAIALRAGVEKLARESRELTAET